MYMLLNIKWNTGSGDVIIIRFHIEDTYRFSNKDEVVSEKEKIPISLL